MMKGLMNRNLMTDIGNLSLSIKADLIKREVFPKCSKYMVFISFEVFFKCTGLFVKNVECT